MDDNNFSNYPIVNAEMSYDASMDDMASHANMMPMGGAVVDDTVVKNMLPRPQKPRLDSLRRCSHDAAGQKNSE